MSSIRAIIPAAGIGKRMRPLTHSRPKVLLPLAGKTIIGHLISDLVKVGINDITVVIGYFGEKVAEYCVASFPEVSFRFIEQKDRLGLGHAIGMAIQPGDENVLVVLGDTLFKADMSKFTGDEAALGLARVDDPRRFGVAVIENNFIIDLEEKPEKPRSNFAVSGIYYFPDAQIVKEAVDTLVKENITTKEEYQITDAMQLMIKDNNKFRPVMIDGWYDCGIPATLVETNRILLEKDQSLSSVSESIQGKNTIIDPVYIDDSAEISDSVIGPFVHVGSDCKLNRSIIRNSIINDNSTLNQVHLEDSVLGMDTVIESKGKSFMLGDHSTIEE